MNEYITRARAGCAFLDDHFGNASWRDRLDLDVLNVGNRLLCVIGQLFIDAEGLESPRVSLPAYAAAQRELGIDGDHPRNAELGFDLSGEELDGDQRYEYERLTVAWIVALNA